MIEKRILDKLKVLTMIFCYLVDYGLKEIIKGL